jgi:hypothetical protein
MSALDQVSGSRDLGIALSGELLQHGAEPLGALALLLGSFSLPCSHSRKTAPVAMGSRMAPHRAVGDQMIKSR